MRRIEPGDHIHVAPSAPRKRDGFEAFVSKVKRREGQVVVIVPERFPKSLRLVPIERVARVHRRAR